jgi:uncharacterized protein (DUF1501 family)
MLTGGLASAGLLGLGWSGVSLAANRGRDRPRLLLVLLRGGLDGLAAVPAIGDPDYADARGPVALAKKDVLPLDGLFALHAALAPIAPWWAEGDLAAVHAVAGPDAGRSHFDAQDVLDNGTTRAQAVRTGWLNRAVRSLDPDAPPMALTRQVPLVLRGPAPFRAADPGREVRPDPRLLEDVAAMYASDPELAAALQVGRDTRAMLEAHGGRATSGGRGLVDRATQRLVGRLLASDDGPDIAVTEIDGWDTHTRQGPVLEARLGALADGLVAVREGLGEAWSSTAIVLVSEFGRAVRGNGSAGTDHGTGGVVLLAGGAVNGGRITTDWPGLSTRDRFEGRDLAGTTDVRAVFKAVLADHLRVSRAALDREVFPDSAALAPVQDLFS